MLNLLKIGELYLSGKKQEQASANWCSFIFRKPNTTLSEQKNVIIDFIFFIFYL